MFYSDWCSGTIQNGLTPLTLHITEDSAKHMVDCIQLSENSGIGLLGERNLYYVSPALSEIYTTDGILTWAKVALI